ncbi:hypothetical protein PRIPAC_91906 [Pristionchus pacificus]|uniref:G protein-coupled receptor n=1 Tax=Pristionchus pacificus TaxID=54126 RepID=A0A2A6CIQ8_PRIPA|nr:hypothetical protein PRIPAC_91906 [Pristionchus pacificus]|eukprot:PDM77901.1 G protein-coupled receptor [Pristionchus pacificus]
MAEHNENSIHFIIISTAIFVISFFGLIGNFHVIWAVKAFPELRSKNGVLLCFLACHHCFCLAFETLSGIRMQLGPSMTRTQCYSSIFIYMYCINHHTNAITNAREWQWSLMDGTEKEAIPLGAKMNCF